MLLFYYKVENTLNDKIIISSVDDMNSAVRKITDILYDCAFDIFGRTVLIRDNNNSERPNNEWFNEGPK